MSRKTTKTKPPITDPQLEFGDTGTRRWGGFTSDEFLIELQRQHGAEMYDEMRKSNSTISAVLKIMTQLLYKVKWKWSVQSTNNDDENKSRIIEDMFFDMEKNFTQVLTDVFTFIPFGYSLLEIVWKKRTQDGLWGIKKIPLRSQKTIIQWKFDETGTPIGAVQFIPLTGKQITIPMDRLLHFRTTSEADMPEGESILRGCYEDYVYVKAFKKIEAANVERDISGIPLFRVPQGYMSKSATPAQKALFENVKRMGENLKANTQSFLALPSDVDEKGKYLWDFELVKAPGTKQIDTHIVIERYQADIAIQLLADFIHMGAKKAGGTYNLAEVKIKFFSQSLNYYLDVVQDVFNTKLIPLIYQMNNWPIENKATICKMSHGTTDTIDFEVLANSVMKLVQVQAIDPDDSLDKWLRRAGNLPQKGEDVHV